MDNNKEDKSHLDNIRKKIDDLFKDGKIIFDGPISVRDKFWKEVKNSQVNESNFIKYLREERDKASQLAEVSNDPSFWLGKVDAFLDIENKVLSILKKYKEK
jgi:hypothetical protein